MDILNLPGWQVMGVHEQHHAYTISAEYTTPPNFCPRCACAAQILSYLNKITQNDVEAEPLK